MKPLEKQVTWILAALGAIFVSDQITKEIVVRTIEPHAPYRGDVFFHITHQRNTGLIGGAFSEIPMIAYVAPVFAFCVLVYMYTQLNPGSRVQAIAYGMIMGGAMGNILDRIRFQSVTDFLQFHFLFIPFDFPWKYYPSFNIADVGIMVGLCVLFVALNLNPKPESDAHVSRDL